MGGGQNFQLQREGTPQNFQLPQASQMPPLSLTLSPIYFESPSLKILRNEYLPELFYLMTVIYPFAGWYVCITNRMKNRGCVRWHHRDVTHSVVLVNIRVWVDSETRDGSDGWWQVRCHKQRDRESEKVGQWLLYRDIKKVNPTKAEHFYNGILS